MSTDHIEGQRDAEVVPLRAKDAGTDVRTAEAKGPAYTDLSDGQAQRKAIIPAHWRSPGGHDHPIVRRCEFGRGRCTMQADGILLALRAEAADEEAVHRVQDIITREIERFGSRDQLTVSWHRTGPPIRPAGQAS